MPPHSGNRPMGGAISQRQHTQTLTFVVLRANELDEHAQPPRDLRINGQILHELLAVDDEDVHGVLDARRLHLVAVAKVKKPQRN